MPPKYTYSNLKDWPLRKLKREAAELHGFLHSPEACVGCSDFRCLDLMLGELTRRGVDFDVESRITFK